MTFFNCWQKSKPDKKKLTQATDAEEAARAFAEEECSGETTMEVIVDDDGYFRSFDAEIEYDARAYVSENEISQDDCDDD
jgi:hypothetical protein